MPDSTPIPVLTQLLYQHHTKSNPSPPEETQTSTVEIRDDVEIVVYKGAMA